MCDSRVIDQVLGSGVMKFHKIHLKQERRLKRIPFLLNMVAEIVVSDDDVSVPQQQ